ncbi:histidine kinase [Modestobacter sp. VKM Ac-2977]|uniref:sensor histidine kinase n=1 Tax=Modestobacter sp. VKM Ac-2977 TaxID=3004131 RepID=UPI0022AA6DD2|nr:histidine kinase [Modestobacter sp. VKM Ac-2977]MCZ2821668.1 histidine kinase [Modestobacter sp. VKM Ac-2977]
METSGGAAVEVAGGRRWPWARLRDLAFVALGVLGAATLVIGEGSVADIPTWTWLQALGTLTVAVALWWRRRYPVHVALLGCVVVAVGGSWLPVWLALLTVAIRHRDRWLALVVAAALAALVANGATEIGLDLVFADPLYAVVTAAFAVAMIGFPVLLGAYLGARRDLVQSLQERVAQTQAEQRLRVEQTRQAERTRIAREMHDVLAHRMSLVALHAGGLEVNPTAGPAEVEQSAALIRTTARQALEELRTVLGVLRADTSLPEPVDPAEAELLPQPTLADVDRLVRASAEAGVAVQLHTDLPTGQTPPPLVGRTAHRVVREALTNVHKHAAGGTATVLLAGEPGSGLQVRVHNSAPVAAAAPLVPGAGLGLLGLRERVELVGGRLSTGAQPDGFLVHADLPWPDRAEGDLT